MTLKLVFTQIDSSISWLWHQLRSIAPQRNQARRHRSNPNIKPNDFSNVSAVPGFPARLRNSVRFDGYDQRIISNQAMATSPAGCIRTHRISSRSLMDDSLEDIFSPVNPFGDSGSKLFLIIRNDMTGNDFRKREEDEKEVEGEFRTVLLIDLLAIFLAISHSFQHRYLVGFAVSVSLFIFKRNSEILRFGDGERDRIPVRICSPFKSERSSVRPLEFSVVRRSCSSNWSSCCFSSFAKWISRGYAKSTLGFCHSAVFFLRWYLMAFFLGRRREGGREGERGRIETARTFKYLISWVLEICFSEIPPRSLFASFAIVFAFFCFDFHRWRENGFPPFQITIQ